MYCVTLDISQFMYCHNSSAKKGVPLSHAKILVTVIFVKKIMEPWYHSVSAFSSLLTSPTSVMGAIELF